MDERLRTLMIPSFPETNANDVAELAKYAEDPTFARLMARLVATMNDPEEKKKFEEDMSMLDQIVVKEAGSTAGNGETPKTLKLEFQSPLTPFFEHIVPEPWFCLKAKAPVYFQYEYRMVDVYVNFQWSERVKDAKSDLLCGHSPGHHDHHHDSSHSSSGTTHQSHQGKGQCTNHSHSGLNQHPIEDSLPTTGKTRSGEHHYRIPYLLERSYKSEEMKIFDFVVGRKTLRWGRTQDDFFNVLLQSAVEAIEESFGDKIDPSSIKVMQETNYQSPPGSDSSLIPTSHPHTYKETKTSSSNLLGHDSASTSENNDKPLISHQQGVIQSSQPSHSSEDSSTHSFKPPSTSFIPFIQRKIENITSCATVPMTPPSTHSFTHNSRFLSHRSPTDSKDQKEESLGIPSFLDHKVHPSSSHSIETKKDVSIIDINWREGVSMASWRGMTKHQRSIILDVIWASIPNSSIDVGVKEQILITEECGKVLEGENDETNLNPSSLPPNRCKTMILTINDPFSFKEIVLPGSFCHDLKMKVPGAILRQNERFISISLQWTVPAHLTAWKMFDIDYSNSSEGREVQKRDLKEEMTGLNLVSFGTALEVFGADDNLQEYAIYLELASSVVLARSYATWSEEKGIMEVVCEKREIGSVWPSIIKKERRKYC